MQKESFEMRPDTVVGLAPESAAYCATVHRETEVFERCAVPRNSALSGLAVAVALSIAVWTAVAALVWLVLR